MEYGTRHPETRPPQRNRMTLRTKTARDLGISPGTYAVRGASKHDGLSDTGIYIEWADALGKAQTLSIGMYAEGRGLRPGDQVEVTIDSPNQFVPEKTMEQYGLSYGTEYSVVYQQTPDPEGRACVTNDRGELVPLRKLRSTRNAFLGEQQSRDDVVVFAKS